MPGHTFLRQRYEHLYRQAQELEKQIKQLDAELSKCRLKMERIEDQAIILTLRLLDLLKELEKELEDGGESGAGRGEMGP